MSWQHLVIYYHVTLEITALWILTHHVQQESFDQKIKLVGLIFEDQGLHNQQQILLVKMIDLQANFDLLVLLVLN